MAIQTDETPYFTSNDHMDYVADVIVDANARPEQLRGYAFEEEPPTLRHFLARFRPLH